MNPSLRIEGAEKGYVPVQIIFCLKEKNQKKINSHRWFFNAFGPILNPNVCVLLDVGTRPGVTSIYHLWKVSRTEFKTRCVCTDVSGRLSILTQMSEVLVARLLHSRASGGGIYSTLSVRITILFRSIAHSSLVAAQNFEYKMSNILDKPL